MQSRVEDVPIMFRHIRAAGAQAAAAAILITLGATMPARAAGPSAATVSVDLPPGRLEFPGGAAADAINRNCVACHSPGMVLTQPRLGAAAWQAEVAKMRGTFKAPVAPEDVPAILGYLAARDAAK